MNKKVVGIFGIFALAGILGFLAVQKPKKTGIPGVNDGKYKYYQSKFNGPVFTDTIFEVAELIIDKQRKYVLLKDNHGDQGIVWIDTFIMYDFLEPNGDWIPATHDEWIKMT